MFANSIAVSKQSYNIIRIMLHYVRRIPFHFSNYIKLCLGNSVKFTEFIATLLELCYINGMPLC